MRKLLVLLSLLLAAGAAGAQTDAAIRRFALVAGANGGGYDRVRLRYAASDARAFAAVIEQLGGVRADDRILLIDPDFAAFQEGLRRIRSLIQSAEGGRERRELIVYYSGHADDEGLLLGRERFAYSRLRREVSEMEADVRIAIVDSCSSGSLTRLKGGSRRPAFLLDGSTEMKGYAFLTSSSADEVAQESDRIGGSFFTHHLVAGLRGAADSSGDGLVTLNEAYAYAFAETLASTERTQYGPQHPAYDIALTGKGDLVLTDLRETAARLILGSDVGGRLFVRDRSGDLVVELVKRPGDTVALAVQPGPYSVRLQDGERWYEATVVVSRETRLERAGLKPVAGEATARRGGGDDPGRKPADDYRTRRFSIGLLSGIGEGGLYGSRERRSISLDLLIGSAAAVDGVAVAGIASFVADRMDGAQLAGIANSVGQDMWGAQLAGVANYVGRDAGFYQSAGVINLTRGSMMGWQNAGVLNLALGGIEGGQAAGIGNVSGEDTVGLQAGGLFDFTQGEMRGLQASGAGNIAGAVRGTQISGLFNYSGDSRGAQISTVNISGGMRGAQVGVVNVAGAAVGVQLGLINISDHIDGVPIGLINYERGGSQHLEICWQGDRLSGALRLGAGVLYTLLRATVVRDSDPLEWSIGGGLGVQVPLAPFFIDLDASVSQRLVGSQPITSWSAADLKPEVRLAAGFAPWGGAGVLVGTSFELEVPGWHTSADSLLRVLPTAFVGLQVGRGRSSSR